MTDRRPRKAYRPRMDLRDRFWSHVADRGEDECWLWTGPRKAQGYGIFAPRVQSDIAHRIAWILANRSGIPDGLYVCHRCDNPPCCNPAHLFLGTPQANSSDRDSKGRNYRAQRTHCPRGHAYDAVNTYITPRGKRDCRTCRRDAYARYRMRRSKTMTTSDAA